MSDTDDPKKMPKGGRKGGTDFPQVPLKEAVGYAKKLVSKTHTGAQPASIVLPGAFGSSSDAGKTRASALKKYGLLEGTIEAYCATKLAKDLDAAPDDEKPPLVQQAFLNWRLFKNVYDIFVGDGVAPAKIRQQMATLGVHPDNAEKATRLFIEGAIFAGLARMEGESVVVLRQSTASASQTVDTVAEQVDGQEDADIDQDQDRDTPEDEVEDSDNGGSNAAKPKAAVGPSVKFNVDSHTDPEKLEKQLKLFRKYGII